MADVVQGVVRSLDRANGAVKATLADGSQIVAAAFFGSKGRAPWPLCTAHFLFRNGGWVCWGPVGHRRLVFNEDFTIVPTTTGTIGGASAACDTPWSVTTSGGVAGTLQQGTFGDSQGAAQLSKADGNSVSIIKDAGSIGLPIGDGALHIAIRCALGSLPGAGWFLTVGLRDAGSNNLVIVRLLGDGTATFVTRRSDTATTTTQVQGTVVNAAQWYWVDIVYAEGFAAGWIDGDGPYANIDNLPVLAVSPTVQLLLDPAAALSGYADSYSLSAVQGVNDPTPYKLN